MFAQMVRLKDDGDSTIGHIHINGQFECFTLEDTHNEPKIYGKTRIPAGTYDIKLRHEGGMNNKYSARDNKHEGMLWLQNVANFKWVYIHRGNTEGDTDGCILLGADCITSSKQHIESSTLAYKRFYAKVLDSIAAGEDITIQII